MSKTQEHAKELWQARCDGSLCPFPKKHLTVTEAYELQHAETDVSGAEVCGYKIGATADETQAILGLSTPFYGPIFSSYTTHTASDATLDLPLFIKHFPRVESEFIACMKHDVQRDKKDLELQELLEHIDWVAPGFEFVGSRYTAPDGSPGTSVIGDFGAHQHSVIGAPYENWRSLDLNAHPVSLAINGKHAATGHSGMSIYGHPLEFVCWLLNQPGMTSGLKAGQLISCGTHTGAIPVAAGDLVEADYGPMGALKVQISALS